MFNDAYQTRKVFSNDFCNKNWFVNHEEMLGANESKESLNKIIVDFSTSRVIFCFASAFFSGQSHIISISTLSPVEHTRYKSNPFWIITITPEYS